MVAGIQTTLQTTLHTNRLQRGRLGMLNDGRGGHHPANAFDRFVVGLLLKAGSTQALHTLTSVIGDRLICDDQLHACQWSETGKPYLLQQHRTSDGSSVPSPMNVAEAAVRRLQDYNQVNISALPWQHSSTSLFAPQHRRTFRIMIVREPCDCNVRAIKPPSRDTLMLIALPTL